MMLFFAAEKNRVVELVEQLLDRHRSRPKVTYFRTLGALERRLRQPRHNIEIVLISISGAIEMAKLTEMRQLLMDLRLLLVLPKRNEDTVAWAHKLGPRFIAYADNGVEQIGAVLSKMLEKAPIKFQPASGQARRHGSYRS